MKYAAIADWATDKQYSVAFMCAQLGVVREGLWVPRTVPRPLVSAFAASRPGGPRCAARAA